MMTGYADWRMAYVCIRVTLHGLIDTMLRINHVIMVCLKEDIWAKRCRNTQATYFDWLKGESTSCEIAIFEIPHFLPKWPHVFECWKVKSNWTLQNFVAMVNWNQKVNKVGQNSVKRDQAIWFRWYLDAASFADGKNYRVKRTQKESKLTGSGQKETKSVSESRKPRLQ